MSEEREYVVTVQKGVDWLEVHRDIINDTTEDNSVDSSIVPDRSVPIVKERAVNKRNTHYSLTDEEAEQLRADERILAVQAVEEIPEPEPMAVQDGNFNRASSSSGQQDNWGLLRHTATENIYGSSFLDPGGTYDYVLDGSGVDVVMMDTGVQADHPEWENKFGTSRLIQIDWYDASGVPGTQPANFYTDVNGHGTHCLGTMAGKTFGWAKNALIYNLTTYGNTGNNIPFSDAIDCLIGWHNNKPINPATGVKRPTVVNMSFQYTWYLDTSITPNELNFTSTGAGYDVTGGRHRGSTHSITTRANLLSKGVVGSNRGNGQYMFGRKFANIDADVAELIDNGIHVCTAAGNDYMKIAHPGDQEYNNYITIDISGTDRYMYYHRGPSPATFEGGDSYTSSNEQDFTFNFVGSIVSPVGSPSFNDGFEVGALDNSSIYDSNAADYLDRKANFSNAGPGVDIYAAGDAIISAGISTDSNSYFYGTTGTQTKKSGTSMATPQMCGMIACLLQAHPEWTPYQVKQYFLNNSQPLLYETANNDDDYTATNSIRGGENRIAYLPMNGAKIFNYGQ